MAAKKKAKKKADKKATKAPAKRAAKASPKRAAAGKERTDAPNLFRLNVEVGDLAEAARFYSTLLGIAGTQYPGSRIYFACGAVTLQVVDVSSHHTPHPAAKALYFTVRDLDAVHARAAQLDCLSEEDVHGRPGGQITVQPWGERSFYVEDPWHNPLCFVEAGTVFGA
ncbi:MAG TPA: VOC family protein [Planctomycetota bacterium]|nr:VOC family protein [Planctomycetota bacterium]